MKEIELNGQTIKVIEPNEYDIYTTDEDKDMDRRAQTAVRHAIERLEVMGIKVEDYNVCI